MAAQLVRGCDVWINLPRPPLEASGTSGMKNVINGGLQLSVLDGWWAEGYDGGNGWALSGDVDHDHGAQDARHAHELFRLLEEEVAPEFYRAGADGIPRDWVARIRRSLRTLGPEFGAGRMLEDYEQQGLQPAGLGLDLLVAVWLRRESLVGRARSAVGVGVAAPSSSGVGVGVGRRRRERGRRRHDRADAARRGAARRVPCARRRGSRLRLASKSLLTCSTRSLRRLSSDCPAMKNITATPTQHADRGESEHPRRDAARRRKRHGAVRAPRTGGPRDARAA